MNSANLGRLERVDLRNVWTIEAGDFTPWLAAAANLSLLGDTIGLELELEAQEKDVGPFRADILCKDTASDAWVLIENQLERTDHTHLGQLLTYAAGLKAVTIVWIAHRFTDEHRATLDWLNEITDDRFNFFGLEVELWRIGESAVAPKFNAVCKPNDWSRTVARSASQVEAGAQTERKQMQLEFWTAFRDFVTDRESRIKATKPFPQHWMNIAVGRSGFHLAAIAAFFDSVAKSYDSHELRAELLMNDTNSKTYFTMLEEMKLEIETALGESLTWHNPPNARMCRLYLRRTVNLEEQERWPEYHDWLLQKLEALHAAFAPRVTELDASSYQPQ
jgi:hypothetical protein